jgi:hypothetical protein
MKFSKREQRIFDYIYSYDASSLEERVTDKVLSNKQALVNVSSSSNPDPLLYLVEDRIYDKFSSQPDIIVFSHPLNVSLMEDSHAFYVDDQPLSWVGLQESVNYFQLSTEDNIHQVHSLHHNTVTAYCANLNYLFRPSGAHREIFTRAPIARNERASVDTGQPDRQVAVDSNYSQKKSF